MDTLLGLRLLAEQSWGASRQVLYRAIEEITYLRKDLITAGKVAKVLRTEEGIAHSNKELDRLIRHAEELVDRMEAEHEARRAAGG